MRIETAIIKGLLQDEEYARKVTPFLSEKYFSNEERHIIIEITDFFEKYNKLPTKEVLYINLGNKSNISETTLDNSIEYIREISLEEKNDYEWLISESEKFVQERAVFNAIHEAISIQSGDDKSRDKGAIPSILSDALAVSFDRSIGHDYFEDAESRFDFYHRKEEKLEFDIDILNKITNGGLSNKTLTCFAAATGVGKSLVMCHMAGHHVISGHNVLYISMEMSEERLAERIDARLFNIPIQDIKNMGKESFDNKINKLKNKTKGKLIFKEFPTGGAHVGHFRALIEELRVKKNFVPRVIYVDYLNICASSRMKMGGSVNSYAYIKSIAEEIRGLSVEYDVPIITATQFNRTGSSSSDPNLEDTSESMGLPFSLDLYLALISGEELELLNQVLFKQLKNRYNDLNYYKRFVTGIDKSKMMLYNVESSAQEAISNNDKGKSKQAEPDIPVFDRGRKNNDFGEWKI